MKKAMTLLLLTSQLLSTTAFALSPATTTTTETTIVSTTENEHSEFDWSPYENDFLKENKQFALEQLYTHDVPISIESDKVKFTINHTAYYAAHHQEKSTESYHVVFLDIAYQNKTNQDLYLHTPPLGKVIGYNYLITSNDEFFSQHLSLNKKLIENDYVISANSEMSGATIIKIDSDILPLLTVDGILNIDFPTISTIKDDYNQTEFERGFLEIPINEDGLAKISSNADFYLDTPSIEKWGTKELIESKKVDETISAIDGIELTVNGYQVTSFTPYEEYKNYFKGIEGDVILFTMEYTLKNNHEKQIINATPSSYLITAEDELLPSGQFQAGMYSKFLNPGEEITTFSVLGMSKEDYEKFNHQSIFALFLISDENLVPLEDNKDYLYKIK